MAEQERSITTTWFLYTEDREPMGKIFRSGEEALPCIGARLTNGAKWSAAEVVSFKELAAACDMRRFEVTIRLL